MPACAASVGRREVGGEMGADPVMETVRTARPRCRSRVALNWAWPPGRLRNTTSRRATARATVATEVLLDHRQGQIDPGGDAGRGPIAAIGDEDRVRLDPDARMALGELGAVGPVRHRAAVVQETGCRQQECPRAHRGDPPSGCGGRSQPADQVDVAGSLRRRRDRRRRSACPGRHRSPAGPPPSAPGPPTS